MTIIHTDHVRHPGSSIVNDVVRAPGRVGAGNVEPKGFLYWVLGVGSPDPCVHATAKTARIVELPYNSGSQGSGVRSHVSSAHQCTYHSTEIGHKAFT